MATISKKAAAPKKAAPKKTVSKSNGSKTKTKLPAADNTKSKKSQPPKSGEHGSLLEKLFVDMLKDIYWAENHLIKALGKMQSEATTHQLQDAFEDHLYATKKHVARLEKVFGLLGKKAEGKKCEAMEGLTKEADSIIEETIKGTMTRDAALIIAAQKVEHYEIATYGSLVQLARTMDKEDVARILEKTLWEEEDTDQLLTDIAESDINPMADEEDDEEGVDTDENDGDESYSGADSISNV